FLDRARIAPLTGEQREEIWQRSAGHPLALRLLVQRLEDLPADTTVEAALAEVEPIRESIEELYHSYWSALRGKNPELAHLIALLARRRPVIDLDWVAQWTAPTTMDALRHDAYQYFWRE